MTGAGWEGKRDGGWGPEETVAAEYAGFGTGTPAPVGGAGREAGAGGSVFRGAGMAAGPIPGPMALTSCL